VNIAPMANIISLCHLVSLPAHFTSLSAAGIISFNHTTASAVVRQLAATVMPPGAVLYNYSNHRHFLRAVQ
jgi:hypothetical protein